MPTNFENWFTEWKRRLEPLNPRSGAGTQPAREEGVPMGMVVLEPSPADSDKKIDLDQLPSGAMILVDTQNSHYVLQTRADSQVYVSGHPELCPVPIAAKLIARGDDGHRVLARGMPLEFVSPKTGFIRSTPIRKLSILVCERGA